MAVSANRLELLQIADAVAREKAIDRGIVIAGLRNVLSTRFMQALPRPVLLSTLRKQHPGLRRDRRSVG